jgi:hypothetical protein
MRRSSLESEWNTPNEAPAAAAGGANDDRSWQNKSPAHEGRGLKSKTGNCICSVNLNPAGGFCWAYRASSVIEFTPTRS